PLRQGTFPESVGGGILPHLPATWQNGRAAQLPAGAALVPGSDHSANLPPQGVPRRQPRGQRTALVSPPPRKSPAPIASRRGSRHAGPPLTTTAPPPRHPPPSGAAGRSGTAGGHAHRSPRGAKPPEGHQLLQSAAAGRGNETGEGRENVPSSARRASPN